MKHQLLAAVSSQSASSCHLPLRQVYCSTRGESVEFAKELATMLGPVLHDIGVALDQGHHK